MKLNTNDDRCLCLEHILTARSPPHKRLEANAGRILYFSGKNKNISFHDMKEEKNENRCFVSQNERIPTRTISASAMYMKAMERTLLEYYLGKDNNEIK